MKVGVIPEQGQLLRQLLSSTRKDLGHAEEGLCNLPALLQGQEIETRASKLLPCVCTMSLARVEIIFIKKKMLWYLQGLQPGEMIISQEGTAFLECRDTRPSWSTFPASRSCQLGNSGWRGLQCLSQGYPWSHRLVTVVLTGYWGPRNH